MAMKRYRVILSEDAAWDMQEIHDYIRYELFSPKAAEEQYRRIAKAIQRLATFPHRCPVMISTPDFPEELRRLVADRYVLLHFIRGDAIVVLDVFYGPSDLERKLEQMKLRF